MSADLSAVNADHLVSVIQRQGVYKGLGWRSIDALELGVNPGELTVVAGRPGHGKTTVLLNIMIHWLEQHPDQTFIMVSHEIPPESVLVKILCILSRRQGDRGWSYGEMRQWLRTGRHDDEKLDTSVAEEALARIRAIEDRLFIIYEPEWSTAEISAYVAKVIKSVPSVGAVFVDYLQLVPAPPGEYESREHEISVVAKRLKHLAVEAECPVIAAAQIGREAAYTVEVIPNGSLEDERVLREISKRRPQLHHLREGGGEQEADFVVGILNYRADFVSIVEAHGLDLELVREVGDATPFDLCILKNRFGRVATVPLIFEARNGLIRDPGVFGK